MIINGMAIFSALLSLCFFSEGFFDDITFTRKSAEHLSKIRMTAHSHSGKSVLKMGRMSESKEIG